MAVPKTRPETTEAGASVQPSEHGEKRVAADPQSVALRGGASPARRLQALLEAELHGRRAPSARRSLTMILVLSLACSVAALSFYNLEWF